MKLMARLRNANSTKWNWWPVCEMQIPQNYIDGPSAKCKFHEMKLTARLRNANSTKWNWWPVCQCVTRTLQHAWTNVVKFDVKCLGNECYATQNTTSKYTYSPQITSWSPQWMRVLRQCKVTRAEVMFVTIHRENIRPSKKEINKAVTMFKLSDVCS
jgi:hypothetical protein